MLASPWSLWPTPPNANQDAPSLAPLVETPPPPGVGYENSQKGRVRYLRCPGKGARAPPPGEGQAPLLLRKVNQPLRVVEVGGRQPHSESFPSLRPSRGSRVLILNKQGSGIK